MTSRSLFGQSGLRTAPARPVEAARYAEAASRGDARNVSPIVGEAIGLIQGVAPAGTILRTMITEAEIVLEQAPAWIRP